jgi:hypothetical protein
MGTKNPKALDVALDDPKRQAWRSPVQQELEGLFGELAAFNERIAELVKQGHRSHAMNVLKAQALRLAGQIDELRCLLVAPKTGRSIAERRPLPAFTGPGPRSGALHYKGRHKGRQPPDRGS